MILTLTNSEPVNNISHLQRGTGKMGYTPDWWQKNRDKINSGRNEKYAKDPDYREQAKKRSKNYRDRKRAEREAEPVTIMVNGEERPAMTTQEVCAFADITTARIKYMQRAGYLPAALVTRPARLYTKRQAQLIRDLETFLRKHQDTLRGPSTSESEKVAQRLATKTATIETQWST